MNSFPLILLGVTLILVIPSKFIKSRYQKYTKKMKEFVWTDNYEEITQDELKTMMLKIDSETGTTQTREQSFNYFAKEFVHALIEELNNSALSKSEKIKKLRAAEQLINMNFEVEAKTSIEEAVEKLQGNVKL